MSALEDQPEEIQDQVKVYHALETRTYLDALQVYVSNMIQKYSLHSEPLLTAPIKGNNIKDLTFRIMESNGFLKADLAKNVRQKREEKKEKVNDLVKKGDTKAQAKNKLKQAQNDKIKRDLELREQIRKLVVDHEIMWNPLLSVASNLQAIRDKNLVLDGFDADTTATKILRYLTALYKKQKKQG